MTVTDAAGSSLTVPSANPTAVYHEVFDADGRPRAAWLHFVERLKHVSAGELTHRSQQVTQLLDENGVTFNVFLEGKQSQRPWSLDLLPLIIGAAEWERLSAGLRQRVRLLDRIVADCYGPRELIRDGTLPPEVLFANPGFVRPFVGLHQSTPSISLYASELARSPDGVWRVMADRAEAPAGAAFALENRIAASRTIPPILSDPSIQRLAPFFLTMQNSLKAMGRRFSENPRVVLLSPGAKYPYYFEDVYLARYLGYTLVEGADLAVRDDRVFLKTLAGLVPIDVIISRGVEHGIDPLELGGGEPHGVPGLLKVIREQKVAVANVPGCGLIESPIFMAFLPQVCRRLFGEDLLMPSIATWWCGDPVQCDFVLRRLNDLVIKPAFQASGGEEIIVQNLDAANRQRLVAQILAQPYHYVAQELVARSCMPVFRGGKIGLGHAAVRTFLAADGADYAVMPGGLVRFAATAEPMVLSISAGEGSKDMWVLAESQVPPVSLLSDTAKPVPLRRTSAVFPSRVADDLFWFGQSLDRADFLARLLRAVIERLTAESVADVPELASLIRALADQGQVEPGYAIASFSSQMPTLAEQLPRMVSNVDEPRGIASAISEMDRLASLERLWMSPDTARKVREMALAFRNSIEAGWSDLVDVLEAVNDVILNAAAVSGLIHDGMVRGPAWRLLDMGRQLEGTRHTASLLRSLIPAEAMIERPVLKALLEVIDCRMTYRSRYFDNLQQNAVLDLCLTDDTCPRSLVVQLASLVEHVDALPGDDGSLLRS
ncbi:MAG TPA: circularly permuted type 2 ATP-grasp protein, partial [Planctomycetaceae bacterium]|nr:circularly permuted type 2 ATP-grasp protein [Planctomycetaceae bacterium]